MKLLLVLCFGLPLILLPGSLAAEDSAVNKTSPKASFWNLRSRINMDKWHTQISTRLNAPALWFDNFFGDERSDEEPAGTLLRVTGSARIEDGEPVDFSGRVRARLSLPRLKRRFHLVLTSSEDDALKELTGEKRTKTVPSEPKEATSLALQYTQKRSSKYSLVHQLRFDLDGGLNPGLRSRGRINIPIMQRALLRLTQTLYWENKDGFGETSRIDYEYPLPAKVLLRESLQGTFSESSQGMEWQLLSEILKSLSPKKALAVGAFAQGETSPRSLVTEYNLFLKYRQNWLKKWLFVELKPELFWPREKNFRTTPAITLSLELQFGDRLSGANRLRSKSSSPAR